MDLYIITGASRGLGLALAQIAIEHGQSVLGLARSKIPLASERLRSLQIDLHQPPADAFGELERFNNIHLVNNAAQVEPIGTVDKNSANEIEQGIQLNLISPMILTARFLKATHNHPGWRVVTNISSGVAERGKAEWSSYSAAKAGLKIFSYSVAQENHIKSRSLNFNPGIMDTEMQSTLRASEFQDVERFRNYKRQGQLAPPKQVALTLYKILAHPERIDRVDYSV